MAAFTETGCKREEKKMMSLFLPMWRLRCSASTVERHLTGGWVFKPELREKGRQRNTTCGLFLPSWGLNSKIWFRIVDQRNCSETRNISEWTEKGVNRDLQGGNPEGVAEVHRVEEFEGREDCP